MSASTLLRELGRLRVARVALAYHIYACTGRATPRDGGLARVALG